MTTASGRVREGFLRCERTCLSVTSGIVSLLLYTDSSEKLISLSEKIIRLIIRTLEWLQIYDATNADWLKLKGRLRNIALFAELVDCGKQYFELKNRRTRPWQAVVALICLVAYRLGKVFVFLDRVGVFNTTRYLRAIGGMPVLGFVFSSMGQIPVLGILLAANPLCFLGCVSFALKIWDSLNLRVIHLERCQLAKRIHALLLEHKQDDQTQELKELKNRLKSMNERDLVYEDVKGGNKEDNIKRWKTIAEIEELKLSKLYRGLAAEVTRELVFVAEATIEMFGIIPFLKAKVTLALLKTVADVTAGYKVCMNITTRMPQLV